MTTLYKAYQRVGGEEQWVTCHADTNFSEIKPTFITVLACDSLITKESPKGMIDAAKYLGPLYFDLDAAEIEESIAGAKALWAKLKEYELTASDVEIYLSGKKGLHFLIQPKVFMEKVAEVNKLPAIYKEIAFTLAVDTLDFGVYSARRGRMFRTHYNARDNGNYKVQITVEELASLTSATYAELCRAYRPLVQGNPTFRPQFAILYATVQQRISALKKARTKPVDANTLRKHAPIVQRLMKGEKVKTGVGFNKIAIQLGIYANEAKLTEDDFIAKCEGLINNHTGDGYRYNSPFKRESELRRMYCYFEENSGYQYALGPIQSMLETTVTDFSDDDTEEAFCEDPSGIFVKGNNYYVATEQGDRHIMDGRFKDVITLLDPKTDNIAVVKAVLVTAEKTSRVTLERDDFVSNGSLHRAINNKGCSFTGSDIHSRYIYTHMLKETKVNGAPVYATTSEGLDMICMPHSSILEARKPFMIWADSRQVRVPSHIAEQGLTIELAPDPGPEPIMKTDLANAPTWPDYAASPANVKCMEDMLYGLVNCQEVHSLSKLIGWTVASFFTQLFRRFYRQYPLLHIAGPAGTGKTRMMESMMHMFYVNEQPFMQPAASTVFALTSAMAGSASIPVVIDEYKPHTMGQQKVEELRSMFRSSYNGHSVTRGGGNRNSTNFRSLSAIPLLGPVVFMAEAMETEPAILHRSVLVTLKRQPGRMTNRTKPAWDMLQANLESMSVVGQHIAASIISGYSEERFRDEFDTIHNRVSRALTLQPEDNLETCDAATLVTKQNMNERIVFNYAVAEFGLHIFKATVQMFQLESESKLLEVVDTMFPALYSEMDKIVKNSVAEYIKVFEMLSDMSRFNDGNPCKLSNGVEFEIATVGGLASLNIVAKTAYNKYRMHCRNIGVLPLFMGDGSFMQAMKDSPLFIRGDTGTKVLRQESIHLDYEAMQRNGVYAFHTK